MVIMRCSFCVFVSSPPGDVTNPGAEGGGGPRQSSLSPQHPFSRTAAFRHQCGPVLDIRADCPPSAQGQFSAESAPDHKGSPVGLERSLNVQCWSLVRHTTLRTLCFVARLPVPRSSLLTGLSSRSSVFVFPAHCIVGNRHRYIDASVVAL